MESKNKLREFRRKKFLTQAELSNLSGLTIQTIISIEKGKHTPQFASIKKLANVLDVEPKDFNFEV
jgi:DNA-binding XRE family transcriptional regulator